VGHAPDGVVEAVELTGRPVLGVQWHPEQLARTEPVFAWLVSTAASRETG
jgi:putative glutamine amidotransferase